MKVGIDCMRFYTPRYYLDLKELARRREVDPGKYFLGLGQEKMSVPPPDEDIITMGATAAAACLEQVDRERLGLAIMATESSLDQSKAAAIPLHRLLELPAHCQAMEIKQACCGSSLALSVALDRVRARPDELVLVVASDVARYGLGSAGEPTQGAAAAAFVVCAEPRLLAVDSPIGSFTEDVMDFWRPTYRDTACVDGKFSIRMYLKALVGAWRDYHGHGGKAIQDFERFCYHQPFTKMAYKAHSRLLRETGLELEDPGAQLEPGLLYNRRIGNSYTASLYISLISLLELETNDLSGSRLGFFAYGSGCTGLFFGGRVMPGYRQGLAPRMHQDQLRTRKALDWDDYKRFYRNRQPQDGSECLVPEHHTGSFRLARVAEHIRYYESSGTALAAASDPLSGVA